MKSYEQISSLQNSLVKKICLLKRDAQERKKEGLTIVEGKNLLLDLLPQCPAEALFVTEKNLSHATHCQTVYLVSDEVMNKISTVETPEGMLALYPIKNHLPNSLQAPCLILDGIQDPGNMGTLLRTASAFSIQNVAVIEPSCDLWHPKVLRAAKGAHFFLHTLVSTSWDVLLPHVTTNNISLLVATLHAEDMQDIRIPEKWALVIGSESKGPSLPQEAPQQTFTIPIAPHVDSLNAAQAGAVILYFLTSKKLHTVRN